MNREGVQGIRNWYFFNQRSVFSYLIFWKKGMFLWIIALKMFIFMPRKMRVKHCSGKNRISFYA